MKTQKKLLIILMLTMGFSMPACELLEDFFADDNDELIDDNDDHIVTDIDGNEYQTVIIDNQQWFAENLRVTRYNNGDPIPTGLSTTEWRTDTAGAYAIYDHTDWRADGIESPEQMVEAYGKLYNWYAVDNPRGLCPAGWRVPSDDEWTQLVDYVASEGFPNDDVVNGAGNALKSCRRVDSPLGDECDTEEHPRWDRDPGGPNYGFDEFGFAALPGGFRTLGVPNFELLGAEGHWWSSTESSSTHAWKRWLICGWSMGGKAENDEILGKILYQPLSNLKSGNVIRNSHNKNLGVSVRCVRDH